MEDNELQQKYLELQMLDAQIREIENQLVAVENQVAELNNINRALDELPSSKVGCDLFVPLSQGIFVKAKLAENDSLLVNVGSGVAVKKSIPDAKQMIVEQLAAMKDLRVNLTANIENFVLRARLIEKELIGSQNV